MSRGPLGRPSRSPSASAPWCARAAGRSSPRLAPSARAPRAALGARPPAAPAAPRAARRLQAEITPPGRRDGHRARARLAAAAAAAPCAATAARAPAPPRAAGRRPRRRAGRFRRRLCIGSPSSPAARRADTEERPHGGAPLCPGTDAPSLQELSVRAVRHHSACARAHHRRRLPAPDALANNLANAETPGYQRVDVDFHGALQPRSAPVTPSSVCTPPFSPQADGSVGAVARRRLDGRRRRRVRQARRQRARVPGRRPGRPLAHRHPAHRASGCR